MRNSCIRNLSSHWRCKYYSSANSIGLLLGKFLGLGNDNPFICVDFYLAINCNWGNFPKTKCSAINSQLISIDKT